MKPRLLFITPVSPSPDGPGLAMRPYWQIMSLSRTYSIHLLIAGMTVKSPAYHPDIVRTCEQVHYIYGYRYSGWKLSLWNRVCHLMDNTSRITRGSDLRFVPDVIDHNHLQGNKTLTRIAGIKFDQVHVFRLYLASLAEILKQQGLSSFYSLDCDDIESETRSSISALYSENGDLMNASRLKKESGIYYNLETRVIPGFDQVFVCSGRDRNILQKRFPDKRVTVLPNIAPVAKGRGKRSSHPVFTMLFVGTMGYYPNTDAAFYFAEHIAPILREQKLPPWNLRVVGALPKNSWTGRLEGCSEIKLSGWVDDLSGAYDAADIVVTPVRGGCGTRIKILEAFAHGVPVVSTSKGAEGLEVENGVHLLIEDDARLFARACVRLMKDRRMADELSRAAFNLVKSKYSPDIINYVWAERFSESAA